MHIESNKHLSVSNGVLNRHTNKRSKRPKSSYFSSARFVVHSASISSVDQETAFYGVHSTSISSVDQTSAFYADQMPLQTPIYNTDWVVSNTSKVAVAKDKKWFFNYTPFRTTVGHIAFTSQKMQAVGIGDVRLEFNTTSSERGTQAYTTLVIRDVLHCPTATCNIVPFSMEHYELSLQGPNDSWAKHRSSGMVYLFDKVTLWKLWLVGQPKGQSSLDPDDLYYINALWAPEERARFKAYKEGSKGGKDNERAQAEASRAEKKGEDDAVKEKSKKYTKGEKKWIKKHYESERKFLLQQGLSIHDENEREEGKAIVRAMRKEECETEG